MQNDNVINTNEQVNDIQNGIQKEVLGLMLTVSQIRRFEDFEDSFIIKREKFYQKVHHPLST